MKVDIQLIMALGIMTCGLRFNVRGTEPIGTISMVKQAGRKVRALVPSFV
jgi:hypothetical protein